MAIYDNSSRPLWVRMATFFLLGPKRLTERGGGGRNSESASGLDWSTATAAAGLGLAIFLYVTGTIAKYEEHKDEDKDRALALSGGRRDATDSISRFCRTIMNTLSEAMASSSKNDDPLLTEARLKALAKARNEKAREEDDMTIVRHEGSCQCNAVRFQIRAPRTLYVTEAINDRTSSAIQYPHIQVPAKNFVLKSGGAFMQSFQTLSDDANVEAAHSFCSRCGVHLLHATRSSTHLYLNVLTLKKDSFIQKSATGFKAQKENSTQKENSAKVRPPPQKYYAQDDNTSETKATSRSTCSSTNDEYVDVPATSSHSIASSPMSEYSGREAGTMQQNTSYMPRDIDAKSAKSMSLSSRSESAHFVHTGDVPPAGASIQRSVSAPSARQSSSRSVSSRTSRNNNNNMMGSFMNVQQQSSASVRSRRSYMDQGGLVEMDAQSVASSISDANFMMNDGTTGSIFSRTSSSHRSVEQSHNQLRRYLSKHVSSAKPSGSVSGSAAADDPIVSSRVNDSLDEVAQLELKPINSIISR